ncbi:PAS domain-containing protein [Scleromatobacter humisilvae]|uniref:Virulence sensor protein BvgS n=1 Tax=Scleromatobacter humisilvae TaxID=2897159 RepID=A0A9X2C422_9BURK|nr:PAS domain-containing protein [Scleromatobacter humisilvae]MCK9689194.1 PAS domain-containing protein [Scleromatobacter humisilvae]
MGFFADGRTGQRRSRIMRLLPAVAVVAVVALVAGVAVVRDVRQERAQAAARLESVAELRSTQVQAWVDRHMSFAQFIADGTVLAGLYTQWQDQGDAAAGQRLMARAIDSRHADGADSALLVDAAGNVLAREHPADRQMAPELKRTVLDAIAARAATSSSIYGRFGTEIPERLDIVVPLLKTGTPARGAMVLRIDPRRSLFPMLAAWPVPSRTAEAVLWDREGDRVVNISELRGRPGSLGRVSEPVATAPLAIARAMRGELLQGTAIRAVDYAGKDVLWVGRTVPGTDWWLVAKMDMDEVDAPAWERARETLLAAVLALLGAALATRLWSQRRLVRLAEHERHEHRERLRALALLEAIAQSASDAIYAKDLEGRYVFCNRAAAEFVGRRVEDVLGRTSEELFGAEAATRITEDDRKAARGELKGAFEETLPSAHGPVHLLTTKGPLVDAEGTLLGILSVSRDVMPMRQAQRALRESEAHYRSVVSALNEGVFVCDPQGIVISCNPAAERMVGATSEQWAGQSIVAPGWALVDAGGRPMDPSELPIAKVIAGQGPQHDVLVHTLSPAGEPVAYQISSVPVISPDTGVLVSVVTSFADVTRRLRLEADALRHRDELEREVALRTAELQAANAALADSARFSREVTDAIPGLVTYWDRDLRCRFANRSYLENFHRSADQVIGHTRAEIFGKAHEAAVIDRLQLALDGKRQVFEFQPDLGLDGGGVYQVHYVPANAPSGEVHGVYMMAFDISALKRAEAELTRTNEALARSRDEAETANRAKSAFVANMSHEIRTPLNGILGLAYLLARDPRDALQRERLGKIGDAGQHLLQIINDVLDISKIEAGKLTLEEADFSLDTLLSTACDMVGERAQAKGLELVVDTDHLPQRLRGDPTRLSQMVINLLSNAVKFTQSGWVKLKGDLLDDHAGRVHVRFDVQDTGPGIPAERQAELFNAFQQGDNTTTRRFGGTGLGLSLTRNLAAAMGGEVGVVSAPGQGSTFWFTAWLAHAAREDEAATLAPMKAMRILLVDDLPEAAAVLANYLATMGMQVDTHASGEAAVQRVAAEMAQGRPYDLMLVDSSTRCADDSPTLVRLHALMGDGMPPCVLLCSSPEGLSGDRAFGIKVDAVLDKPVTASALHDVVARVLYRQGGARAGSAIVRDASEDLVRERHGGQSVLLAEDNIINRLIARELLTNAGLVVEQAENGAIALELAAQQTWDLILMDMQMPVMDGLVAARAIRERGDTAVPIIAMTANAFVEDRAACLEAGMNDHVAKPVNPAALYAILMRWLPDKR